MIQSPKDWLVRKESWPRFGMKAALMLLALLLAGNWFMNRYRIGIDPQNEKCLPGYTVYLIDLNDRSLQKGAIYSFHAKNLQPLYKDGTRMVKILAGMPGDVVEIDQAFLFHIAHPLVEVEVLDAPGVERRGAADDAVYFVSFFEEEFGEERAVLSRDAGD